MMKPLMAAAVQFAVKPMAVRENLARAHEMIAQCHDATHADLIVLPESFTTGFTPIGGVSALYEAVGPIPGPLTDVGVAWARQFGCHIVFPTYERGPTRDVVYNSASLIGPDGIVGTYRKTHPFPTERLEGGGWTTPGSSWCCLDTPIARIGIVICYDGDFPELARVTALAGAEIIVRPSAFLRTFDHWELTNRARAYDNHVYWIATNSVGRDASGAYFSGGSMIVGPTGFKLAQARGCDEYAFARLEPDALKTIAPGLSSPQTFDHLQDRNLKSYEGILREGQSAFEPAKRVAYKR